MAVTLHTAFVKTCLQTLPKVGEWVGKAEAHCQSAGCDAGTLTSACLAPDQWNFAKQVWETGHHSARAIEGVRAGVFGPELEPAPTDFAALHQQVADSIALLEAVEEAELEEISKRDMRFEFKDRVMPFTVEDFLLTFSLPNFFFHTTTAYSVLRNQGLPLGKMDFLGAMRMRV
jgi:hypothetical protein